jgi:hypothetical protein
VSSLGLLTPGLADETVEVVIRAPPSGDPLGADPALPRDARLEASPFRLDHLPPTARESLVAREDRGELRGTLFRVIWDIDGDATSDERESCDERRDER